MNGMGILVVLLGSAQYSYTSISENRGVNKKVDKKRDNDDEERGPLIGSGGGNGSGNADLMDDKSFDNVGVVGSSPSVLAKRESALGKMRGYWY